MGLVDCVGYTLVAARVAYSIHIKTAINQNSSPDSCEENQSNLIEVAAERTN
ncbi:MAG: hypothetical protein HWQ41_19555 [Nostoc sp. NOS(2021)]|uniref:hypothetical protein n=1 Tax=Nostoc sp. NOS(2021) TaxID=2815407 RepID=UPI0025EB05B9|nr:hypothetical protein [Nostoc sp. NOS(2021)]MBN3897392.1 hypothetical protein [Nostoc sp. NOS(2021)]